MTGLDAFNKENSELLKFILNERFFKVFKDADNCINGRDNGPGAFVELNITSECNLNCEYCYLAKYGDKLYPKEIRTPKRIVNNLKILLKYFEDNKFNINSFDLFSGEIWGTKLSDDIFNLIYDYKKRGASLNFIGIPSNCSFIRDDKKFKNMEDWIEKFKEIGVRVGISASVDGLLIESKVRPYKSSKIEERTEENFYDKLFEFCKKHTYGFHPMVAASSIEYWIDNFKWWMEKFAKYGFTINDIMLLEVRNDNWTDDKIKKYLEFLNFVIEYEKENLYHNDLLEMACDVFGVADRRVANDYHNIRFCQEGTIPACTISRSLVVRLGDLAIGPCHRTCYEKYIYGYFKVENDEIVDIEANNAQLAWKVYADNMMTTYPKCDSCEIKMSCMKGCLGAQLEANNDILYPCESVCRLLKAKHFFLKKKYTDMKLYEIIQKYGSESDKAFVNNFIKGMLFN